MSEINDNFNGYLTIGNDTFVYNANRGIVTLLPAESDLQKQFDISKEVRSRDTPEPEYFMGKEGQTEVAFLRMRAFSYNPMGLDPTVKFFAQIIVKATGNTSEYYSNLVDGDWTKFHSITFYGGNINSLFAPENALVFDRNNPTEIKFREAEKYTHPVEVELNNTKAILTLSIARSWSRNTAGKMGTYSLGGLDSFIRLSFEETQGIETVTEYYLIIKKLVSILTGQNNVAFNTYLSQNSSTQNYPTAVCRIFDSYSNYADMNCHRVISIAKVLYDLPKLINEIRLGTTESLLELLPSDNKEVSIVTIKNVQDLCTALEVSYSNGGYEKREKDKTITELKSEIKKLIKDFGTRHQEINLEETTLSSCFQYLELTLRQKISIMYEDDQKIIDQITKRRELPEINAESIKAFVKLRNSKTHQGVHTLNDDAKIYPALLAIVYVQLFKRIGLSKEQIEGVMWRFI